MCCFLYKPSFDSYNQRRHICAKLSHFIISIKNWLLPLIGASYFVKLAEKDYSPCTRTVNVITKGKLDSMEYFS